ncbi:hypothetical protein [Amycolatopsis sp. NBC_01286]|uniref:hypothetical protein n=1 Tax=Amycolatopsis sp. NBC_01286 TaxID=2903560 RepID=UPI002E14A1AE|nr:hypothetical protein OG570_30715 [Amycolatopsis sp. NBC_01286]
MVVREPALPVDPRLPGEPSFAEVTATRMWLARHGVEVGLPTRLLALRVGTREWLRRPTVFAVLVVCLVFWPGFRAPRELELLRPLLVGVVLAALLVMRWRQVQAREELAESLTGTGTPPPWRAAARQVGWWHLAATAITFGGGAVLCALQFLTEPAAPLDAGARTLGLAAGAGAIALVLGRVLRAPIIAEDAASRAVDGVLRAQDAHRFAPSALFFVAVWPAGMDLDHLGAQGWFALSYLVLAAGTQLVGWLRFRRRFRQLPAGYYGDADRSVSPPRHRGSEGPPATAGRGTPSPRHAASSAAGRDRRAS